MSEDQNKQKNGFQNTDLWSFFEQATNDEDFKTAVKKICEDGEKLSSTIITFFPTFTRHDVTHIQGVCNWMTKLLGDHLKDLKADEAALLLMAACWHDSGMSVTKDEEDELKQRIVDGNPTWHNDKELYDYFEKHPRDAVEYSKDNSTIERILRNYIREHHHERAQNKIDELEWQLELTMRCITPDLLAELCESHGEKLKVHEQVSEDINYELCAVLLRLADILDYDASRAPDILFLHLGLDHPKTAEQKKSSEEFQKNSAGAFKLEDSQKLLRYSAQCSDPNIECGIQDYLKWVEEELDHSRKVLSYSGSEKRITLPFKIESKINQKGYEAGDFKLTMNQDRIIELLAGEKLYSDPGVFVRELLQNAIDAVLDRVRCDHSFSLKDGRIDIYTWRDEEGFAWFRIEDNGTGMNEHILKNYFLKVGCSYYTSDEYMKTELDPALNNGFKPTSRFGIGILSCFMSDKKNTQVEVETMRYSNNRPNPNEVLRLFVPSLTGSYFLLKHNSVNAIKMHTPPGMKEKKETKRTTPGTTICVRVRQLSMGIHSFRELLDKYIVFPEVRITHYAQDTKTYPTQADFMKLVETLHGRNDQPYEYIHPLSGCLFEELKKNMPDWEWSSESQPELIFSYQRCDQLSDYLAGVIPYVCIRTNARCKSKVNYDGKEFTPELRGDIRFSEDGFDLISLMFFAVSPDLRKECKLKGIDYEYILIDQLQSRKYILKIALSEFKSLLSEEEKKIWKYLFIENRFRDFCFNSIFAFNGVLAERDLNQYPRTCILLLHGLYNPSINLARNTILSLPIEAECELALKETYSFDSDLDLSDFFVLNNRYNYRTSECSEAILTDILVNHPDWERKIKYHLCNPKTSITLHDLMEREKTVGRVQVIIGSSHSLLYRYLQLTALRRHFIVDIKNYDNYLICSILASIPKPLDANTISFPPCLFSNNVEPCKRNSKVLRINGSYNPEHRFSQWLIKHRELLQEMLPQEYTNILRMMLRGLDDTDLDYNSINHYLDTLKQYKGISFNITDDLKLQEEECRKLEFEKE